MPETETSKLSRMSWWRLMVQSWYAHQTNAPMHSSAKMPGLGTCWSEQVPRPSVAGSAYLQPDTTTGAPRLLPDQGVARVEHPGADRSAAYPPGGRDHGANRRQLGGLGRSQLDRGAGTGVAPYRAFVEHRREHGHGGDNWLIFGDRNFSCDFLYQLEWLRYRKEGTLTHLDVAFSRDQQEKVYVQHRIIEQAKRLYSWLERGAHVYVCGDADRMAVDVNEALLAVLRSEGGLTDERAAEYLSGLKTAHR